MNVMGSKNLVTTSSEGEALFTSALWGRSWFESR